MSDHPANLCPFLVFPRFIDKVWGCENLLPWFPSKGRKTGEAWYTDACSLTSLARISALSGDSPPAGDAEALTLGEAVKHYGKRLLGSAVDSDTIPLLVKLLFTTEKLSVQVHPGDEWAALHEQSRGKTEMWHVLRAEPGASVAAGFQRKFSRQEVEHAAIDGTIEKMLQWWPVQAGDTIFIPSGTVHAIGPGLVLCEIQQASDVTYRLYDYGRPRPLHLAQSLAVAELGPHAGLSRPEWLGQGRTVLATSDYFRTEQVRLQAGGALSLRPNSRRLEIWIVTEGNGTVGELPLGPGSVFVLPACGGTCALRARSDLVLLHTFPPTTHPT